MAEKIIYVSADECPDWLSTLVFDTDDTAEAETDKESK